MTNPVIMQMFNCTEDLLYNLCGYLLTKSPMFQMLEQLPTLAKLSYKVKVVLIHVDLMEVYNVWVVYLHQNV